MAPRWLFFPTPSGGGPTFTYTKSVLFTASNSERLNMGNVAALDFTGSAPFSIVIWHKNTAVAGIMGLVTKTGGAASTNAGWGLYVAGAALPRFILSNGSGGTLNVFSATTYTNGVWYCTVLTYSGSGAASGVKIYRNGTNLTLSTYSDTFTGTAANTAEARIAARGDGVYYDGNVFTVGIYSNELTAANVTAIQALSPKDLNAGPGTLIGLWRCGNDSDDDLTGTTGIVHDRVGGLDATPINTTTGDVVTDAP